MYFCITQDSHVCLKLHERAILHSESPSIKPENKNLIGKNVLPESIFEFQNVNSEHIKIGSHHFGDLSGFYYDVNFEQDLIKLETTIDELYQAKWIDHQVESLSVIFNLKNNELGIYFSFIGKF